MKCTLLITLTLALVAIGFVSGATVDAKDLGNLKYNKLSDDMGSIDVTKEDLSNVDDNENDLLLNYDPTEPRYTNYFTTSRNANNKIKVQSYTNLEREATANKKPASVVTVREVMSADASGARSPNTDRAKDIALNSREVRLVGPNQREIEMKDDLPTKFVVALENLGKEATDVWGQVNEKLDKGWTDLKRSEVWGQVNEKLDKGWTDLKSMVEGVVAPSSKQQPGRKEN